jgi:release factor glutamine methyltransferase
MNSPTLPSIAQLIRSAQQALESISTSPRLDAELLLAHLLDCDRSYFYAHADDQPEPRLQAHFQQLVSRRSQGVPMAYLLKTREFFGLNFEVSPAVLVPRPETELLVETALEQIPKEQKFQVADLGTGSGAIALAIASQRPQCEVIATDRSQAALNVAQRNAQRLHINNVAFRCGSWLEPISEQLPLIVSNPPYVAENDERLNSDSLRHEPLMALTPGSDGMSAIVSIISGATKHLFNKGWLMLEHGYDQAAFVQQLLADHGYGAIASHRDLAGHERITVGQWSV